MLMSRRLLDSVDLTRAARTLKSCYLMLEHGHKMLPSPGLRTICSGSAGSLLLRKPSIQS